jgi:hypothetical protein
MSKTNATAITTAQRRERILSLRLAGLTYAQIGSQVGVSKQAAHANVRKVLDELAQWNRGATECLRALESERLDALARGIWVKAIGGDVQCIDRMLAIMARRAKLFGLDAPTKIAPTTPDGEQSTSTEGTRWVYFMPKPCKTEEEWLEQCRKPEDVIK